ncbi:MAG: helix-turn-helix transcriptional regulator [Clostridia bacterium]|nr:helix-turn-helix transcriptional regulator [Clostridia bacterium]
MSYNRVKLGIIISRLRTKKGLSQEKLSALAGISRSHLTLIENGKKTLRVDTFCNLAYALDILPHELMKLLEESCDS